LFLPRGWLRSTKPEEALALEIHPAADFRGFTQSTAIMAPARQLGHHRSNRQTPDRYAGHGC